MQIIFNLIIGIIPLVLMAAPIVNKQAISSIYTAPVVDLKPVENNSQVLASQEFSLENRYKVQSINDIFADNILLALLYMDEEVQKGQKIDWEKVRESGTASFTLNPGETFAFHDNLNSKLQVNVVQTTNAKFNSYEGFKSDGFIVGDGVCHLASFINVISAQAGLDVYAPVRHDFAQIPDVSREDATSINSNDKNQNLYVTNNSTSVVTFIFEHDRESIKITVESA